MQTEKILKEDKIDKALSDLISALRLQVNNFGSFLKEHPPSRLKGIWVESVQYTNPLPVAINIFKNTLKGKGSITNVEERENKIKELAWAYQQLALSSQHFAYNLLKLKKKGLRNDQRYKFVDLLIKYLEDKAKKTDLTNKEKNYFRELIKWKNKPSKDNKRIDNIIFEILSEKISNTLDILRQKSAYLNNFYKKDRFTNESTSELIIRNVVVAAQYAILIYTAGRIIGEKIVEGVGEEIGKEVAKKTANEFINGEDMLEKMLMQKFMKKAAVESSKKIIVTTGLGIVGSGIASILASTGYKIYRTWRHLNTKLAKNESVSFIPVKSDKKDVDNIINLIYSNDTVMNNIKSWVLKNVEDVEIDEENSKIKFTNNPSFFYLYTTGKNKVVVFSEEKPKDISYYKVAIYGKFLTDDNKLGKKLSLFYTIEKVK